MLLYVYISSKNDWPLKEECALVVDICTNLLKRPNILTSMLSSKIRQLVFKIYVCILRYVCSRNFIKDIKAVPWAAQRVRVSCRNMGGSTEEILLNTFKLYHGRLHCGFLKVLGETRYECFSILEVCVQINGVRNGSWSSLNEGLLIC